jgi:hypothetical protein
MKLPFLLVFTFCIVTLAHAGKDSLPSLDLSGFADVYYAWDINRPGDHLRPGFLYNHNRHNEINLNLGLLSLKVDGGAYRASLGLMAGTYPEYNLALEPGLLKNVFEANAGLALDKNRLLWLDAGIFSSHIGFESAISADNYTHTRSIMAENSPYYLAGAKLSWDAGEKWDLALLVLNGWQRIRRVEGNSLPSFGSQVVFSPGAGIRLNWSTYIGTDDPDSTRRMRYFNNFFGEFRFSEKVWLVAGFDLGLQQQARGASDYDIWMSPAAILRFAPAARWAMALRGEYYEDANGVIIPTGTPSGFKMAGLSFNIDRLIGGNAMFRVEGRWLRSEDPIFETGKGLSRHNALLLCAITVKIR